MSKVVELTAEAFKPGGAVEIVFRRFGRKVLPNDQQRDYAIAVAEAIDAGHDTVPPIALYEASTGIGKSLGYLVPLAISATFGKRAIVSASTIQLQEQILAPGGDFDLAASVAAEVTKSPQVTAAVRKGRSNFIDPNGLSELIRRQEGSASDKAVLDELANWLKETASGDLEEFRQEYGPIPDGIPLSFITARRFDVSEYYDRHVAMAMDADIVVTNHSLLLLHAKRMWTGLLGEHGDYHTLVVDEADRLPAAAESLLSDGFPIELVKNMIGRLPASGRRTHVLETLEKLDDFLQEVYDDAGRFGNLFQTKMTGSYLALVGAKTAPILPRIKRLLKGLDVEITKLAIEARDIRTSERLHDEASSLRAVYEAMDMNGSPHAPISMLKWSPVREYPSLAALPLYPAHIATRLWRVFGDIEEAFAHSVIFTSASLSVPTDRPQSSRDAFKAFAAKIGVTKRLNDRFLKRFMPSSFGSAGFVLADPSVPSPSEAEELKEEVTKPSSVSKVALADDDEAVSETNPKWARYASDMVGAAADREDAFVLVLTTSFKDADLIGKMLQDDGLHGLRIHRAGEKVRQVLEDFVVAGSGVLVTPATWEGVNIPGLTDVVVTRIPLAPMDSLHALVREASLRELGYDNERIKGIMFNHMQEEALRKLYQGLARGIRRADQAVTLWIADPRFPLPDDLVAGPFPDFKQYQVDDGDGPRFRGATAGFYRAFRRSIPIRFREGTINPYDRARVFIDHRIDPSVTKTSKRRGKK